MSIERQLADLDKLVREWTSACAEHKQILDEFDRIFQDAVLMHADSWPQNEMALRAAVNVALRNDEVFQGVLAEVALAEARKGELQIQLEQLRWHIMDVVFERVAALPFELITPGINDMVGGH